MLEEPVAEVRIFDNLSKGELKYLKSSLEDRRCWFYKRGADIRDIDLLNDAMKGLIMFFIWLHCGFFTAGIFRELPSRSTSKVLSTLLKPVLRTR